MLEQLTGYGFTRISPAFRNEELLGQRDELEQNRHAAKILALTLAGISLATIIGALTIIDKDHTHLVAAASSAGLITSIKYGIILHNSNRNLAIIRNSIAKRNEYRHPDDQLV